MNSPIDDAWRRQAVTFRLTKQRVAQLRSIAKASAASLSPTSAIDHAIAIAFAASEARELDSPRIDQAVSELQETVARLERQARIQSDSLAEVAANVRELREVARALDSNSKKDGGAIAPNTLRDWLEVELARQPASALLARAHWQPQQGSGWESALSVERLSGGETAAEIQRRPTGIQLSTSERDALFPNRNPQGRAYLMCQRHGADWTLSAHPVLDDGSPGESMGSVIVRVDEALPPSSQRF